MNYRKDKEQILASIIARLKIPASRIAGVFCRFLIAAPPNNLVLRVPCRPPVVRGWKKHSTLAISNPDGARWAHTISETFLNSFQNLRSIFQNTHNPKENIKLWGIFLENLSICPSSPK